MPIALEKEDHQRDLDFRNALHGKTATKEAGIRSMIGKGSEAQKLAVQDYFKHFDNKSSAEETEADRKARRDEYATLTRHYYNLATDLYEYGWGGSFHFCRFAYGEPFRQAIARHEHYLAHQIGIKENMTVLDVGCGVGGPAREIVKFTGANVVGLNNNDYQIERATHYAHKEGLADKLKFVKGDFMQMTFPDNSFDAVYAIEATVHAPSLEGIYSEIFRVLKPGGTFGVYEWLMTDAYDNDNPHHREIRLGIEQGDGISNMEKVEVALAAMKAAGFELILNEDLADEEHEKRDYAPWYWPLSGELKYIGSVFDFFTVVRMTHTARWTIHRLLGLGEKIGIIPHGTAKTADSLALAADCLVAGGKEKLFTPMYLMVGRKPKA
ncbi:uncharacterized protein PV09_01216 [Verruconis gallopava]|uniref:Sterol 24-C-methyltransferase n=1 Tax=Verruconis gallopava TaxID=253628 RepID=A0A0D2ANI9_9PEZI|nr:uncharacterized protein PV09_01216 [Verruconis gallopava]KIW08298.1 hypothetical protein PV09_01216 [Verruconis gallopava]